MKRGMPLLIAAALAVCCGCGTKKLIDKSVDRNWTVNLIDYTDEEVRQAMPRFKSEFAVRDRTDQFVGGKVVIRWSENDAELEEKLKKFFFQTGMPAGEVRASRADQTVEVIRAKPEEKTK